MAEIQNGLFHILWIDSACWGPAKQCDNINSVNVFLFHLCVQVETYQVRSSVCCCGLLFAYCNIYIFIWESQWTSDYMLVALLKESCGRRRANVGRRRLNEVWPTLGVVCELLDPLTCYSVAWVVVGRLCLTVHTNESKSKMLTSLFNKGLLSCSTPSLT